MSVTLGKEDYIRFIETDVKDRIKGFLQNTDRALSGSKKKAKDKMLRLHLIRKRAKALRKGK